MILVIQCLPIFGVNEKKKLERILNYSEQLGENFIFQKLSAITLEDSGFIWVVDRDANSIFQFDFDGNVVVKLGRKGQGPGEFYAPTDIEKVGEEIWVADHRNGRIQILEKGKHKKTIKLDNPVSPKSILTLGDFVFVGGFYYLDKVSNIAKLDRQGNTVELIDSINVPESPHKRTAGLWRIFELISISDHLLLGFNFDSLVVKVTSSGETRLVKEMDDFYEASESLGGPFKAPGHLLVSSFATGPEDTILMAICDHEAGKNNCSIIYQFDSNLRRIMNRWDIGESVRAMDYHREKGLLGIVTAEAILIYKLMSY
jgi:hypothetical protein